MSRFHGPQHRGVSRETRDRRRLAADVRNALTPPHRRASFGGGSTEQCRPVTVEVDGEQITVSVLAEEPMSEQGRAALAEIIAAAKRRFEAEPRRINLCPVCGFPPGTAAHRRSRRHTAPDQGGPSAADTSNEQPGG